MSVDNSGVTTALYASIGDGKLVGCMIITTVFDKNTITVCLPISRTTTNYRNCIQNI